MRSVPTFESCPIASARVDSTPDGAGVQRQGRLWSTLAELCDLLQIPAAVSVSNERLLFQRVQLRSGQRVHTLGQPFSSLYIVNCGFLKTVRIDEVGHEQVLDFPMKGDMLGVDGIDQGAYCSEAVSLSDCDLVVLPFERLTALGDMHPGLANAMYSVFSRELVREQTMIGMLGAFSAEARVSRFLISLAERFAAIGYSARQFVLRMTRQEIGSYLGLTPHTVSRALSAFHALGLITVNQRTISIDNVDALKGLRGGSRMRSRSGRWSCARPSPQIAGHSSSTD
jgi:CRP/FNR family transcriptional regulator